MVKVFVEGLDGVLHNMFSQREGYEVVDSPHNADLFCLEGGYDIDPALYQEEPHSLTHYSTDKDLTTLGIMSIASARGKPIVGICRGGQMLCAMSGNSLHQHVEGHRMVSETLEYGGVQYNVRSDHHQAFKLAKHTGTECLVMSDDKSLCKIFYDGANNWLGYQPHPEWSGEHSEGRDLFFKLVEERLKP